MTKSSRSAATPRPPAEGERAARRGYLHQDRASARLAYAALTERKLRWIGLADRGAGDVDDLVLGLRNVVIAHQFKRSLNPSAFGITRLLLGAGSEIANLAASYRMLTARHSGTPVRIRYFTNDYPSTNDRLIEGDATATTARFVSDWAGSPGRSLRDWRASRWRDVIDQLVTTSGLSDPEFEAFWLQLELVCGAAASSQFEPGQEATREYQIEELARAISTLVADNRDKDQWSREELLDELGWPDRFALRFQHEFPVGAWVQRNSVTGTSLSAAISQWSQGYISLIGAPGAGKSTLLAREMRQIEGAEVVRYLAFVPGTAQGQGRGEAEAFYHDLTTQLAVSGLGPLRLKDDTLHARREHFELLLRKAGERFVAEGLRTIIIIDGLDHIPREEFPELSLLSALPLPQAVPEGVLFVLGSQRLDLPGMPSAVEEQAGSAQRRIDIAPLTEAAVEAMAKAAQLDPDVDRSELYRIGGGHPLVTHYLIERLLIAEPAERSALLGGELGEGGDLDAVYNSAWRWIDKSSEPLLVKKVLALIAYAQGPIEPELLAEATNDGAVEATLRVARHLLLTGGKGWSVFHNSFRLFIQRKPVERFGKPDPEFSSTAIYRRLGALVGLASPDSPQRWLRFRYAYLAGEAVEALALATRGYFVDQYIAGRSEHSVLDDIRDGYRLLSGRMEPAKLFELLLAEDEVERRASVMESASTLPEAYITMGDVNAAKAELDNTYEAGQQWLVVDALLKEKRIDEARLLFEESGLFRDADTQYQMGRTGEFERNLASWASRAILLLDEGQIEDELRQIRTKADDAFKEEFEDVARQMVAQAFIQADPTHDLDSLCALWHVDGSARLAVAIEGAGAAFLCGGEVRTVELLQIAIDDPAFTDLGASWALEGAVLASHLGDKVLGERFLHHAPLRGPSNVAAHHSEALEEACEGLVAGIITRTALGIPFNEPAEPADRLLRGLQHHLSAVSKAIGQVRSGSPLPETEVQRLVSSALTFLAGAHYGSDVEHGIFFRLPALALILLHLLCDLCELARLPGSTITTTVARLHADGAAFAHWPAFLRASAVRCFDLDEGADDAAESLELALGSVNRSDPQQEVEELARFANDFAAIGRPERARELLAGLRRAAFGAFRPAKKDAQYDTWVRVLSLANRADPARRGQRAITVLHFVEGLQETEGYDMARRMVRQVLFEAAAADTAIASISFDWAMSYGSVGWDGAVDAALRGFVFRNPARAREALTAWVALCLPWYEEPHGSTVATGAFLTDLVGAIDASMVADVERDAAQAIETVANPTQRLRLMKALEKACRKRGEGGLASARLATLASLEAAEENGDADPGNRPYHNVLSLTQCREAIDDERIYRTKPRRGAPERPVELEDYKPSWNLRAAISRVIASSPWLDVEEFARLEPSAIAEPEVALAAARVAMEGGHVEAAERFLAEIQLAESDGWAWPSERRTIQRHEARQLLGISGAQDDARREFARHLAEHRYGVSGILWSIERIFPLLFSDISWPMMWGLLEAQIRLSRDFEQGELLQRLQHQPEPAAPVDDDELLAEIFLKALTLDMSPLQDCAARGACDMLDNGGGRVFNRIVERLLDDESTAMAAADLLTRAVDHPNVRRHFVGWLDDIAGRDDLALVSAAHYLAARWGVSIGANGRPLSPFYQLALPEISLGEGRVSIDPRTRGMFLDDPLGWTQGWVGECEKVAEAGSVSIEHVRRRVGSLIQRWGGVARFGHAGCLELEATHKRLQLRLPYHFPHVAAVFRALRTVAGELHHAGRLSSNDRTALLHALFADASHPMPPPPSPRPGDVRFVRPKHHFQDKNRQEWVQAVDEELVDATPHAILAETQTISSRDSRRVASVERYRAWSLTALDERGLWETVRALPTVAWIGRPCVMYPANRAHPARIASLRSRRRDRLPDELLIVCPHTANALGWRPETGSMHRFVDTAGNLMAWTSWWRDGLPQSLSEDEFRAEGQRICLSEAGLRNFESRFGQITLMTAVWRKSADYGPNDTMIGFAKSTKL